jgi:hypothetical protein
MNLAMCPLMRMSNVRNEIEQLEVLITARQLACTETLQYVSTAERAGRTAEAKELRVLFFFSISHY